MIFFFSNNHTKQRNAVHGRSAELLHVKIGALRGPWLEASRSGQGLIISFFYNEFHKKRGISWVILFSVSKEKHFPVKLLMKTWEHIFSYIIKRLARNWGTLPVAQWLRHCATSRKVAGWISDGVTGIFHWHNPSGRTLAWGRLSL
jgi:hypothetical protein